MNNASIIATSFLAGDLLSSTGKTNVRIMGPGILNAAGASTVAQSFPLELFDIRNGTIADLQIIGSNQGGLNLWGVSSVTVRDITFSGLNQVSGANSPAIGILNWLPAHPTQTSAYVDISRVRCNGVLEGGCIYSDGNYRHSGSTGQYNGMVSVNGTEVISAGDNGVEFDHTSGSISETSCGINSVPNQCVLIRQTARVTVSNTTCTAGSSGPGYCVEVARFAAEDDPVDAIVINATSAWGMSGQADSGGIVIRNVDTSNSVSNVVVNGATLSGSNVHGIYLEGPGAAGSAFEHFVLGNVVSHDNGGNGILIQYAEDVQVNGGVGYNNNQSIAPCPTNDTSAMYISNSSDVVVTGFRAFDNQATKTQCYGLTTDSGTSRTTVTGADLREDLEISGGVNNAGRSESICYRKLANVTTCLGLNGY